MLSISQDWLAHRGEEDVSGGQKGARLGRFQKGAVGQGQGNCTFRISPVPGTGAGNEVIYRSNDRKDATKHPEDGCRFSSDR